MRDVYTLLVVAREATIGDRLLRAGGLIRMELYRKSRLAQETLLKA
jgi:hypothetical protein